MKKNDVNIQLIYNVYARVCVCVVCMCVLQVPVIVVSVSAIPKTGGCPESTVSVTTESVISTTGSSAQVMKSKKRETINRI